MIKRVKRSYLTMLEMLVVLALLVSLAGLGGYLSYTSSKKEEFQAACKAIRSHLEVAEELVGMGVDLEVRFRQVGKKLHLYLVPDRPLEEGPAKRLLSLDLPVEGILDISYEGQPLDQIRLKYASLGMLSPKGGLVLSGRFGHETIPLQKGELLTMKGEEIYPHEVLQKTP